ncbi:MAG: hypothetical protein RIR49_1921 [Actinomycetota bacterium]|jgi:hypothetical protein
MARRTGGTRQQVRDRRTDVRPDGEAASEDRLDQFVTSSSRSVGLLAQARLSVGRVDDPAEVEADRMAAAFTGARRSPDTGGGPAGGAAIAEGGFEVGADTEAAIESARGGGSALPKGLRGEFEGFFGADLGSVRLHTDGKAAGLSRSLGAEAFTVGSDVFFGDGRFDPSSTGGLDLIAHELTHVVQQGGGAQLSRKHADDIEEQLQDGNLEEGDAAELLGAGNDTLGGATGDYDFSGGESGGKVEAGSDGVEAGNIVGIVNSTVGVVSAIKDLWKVLSEPSTTEDKVWKTILAMKASADLAKGAIETHGAVTGALSSSALAAIPGLGLAISVVGLADSLFNKLVPLWKSKESEQKLLDKAREKLAAETDPKKQMKLRQDVAAYETVLSTTKRAIGFTMVDMAGDVTMIVGQIATLAAGPFGLAVTAVGGLVKLGAAVIGKVWEWVASHRAASAVEGAEQAESERTAAKAEAERLGSEALAAAGDSSKTDDQKAAANKAAQDARDAYLAKEEAFDAARLHLLSTDANSAFKRILDMSFEPLRDRPAGTMPDDVRENLQNHGIAESWIKATEQQIKANKDAEIDYGSAVDMAAEMISVGPPLTFGERLTAWVKSIGSFFKKVWNWFKSLGETPPVPVVSRKYVEDEFKAAISSTVVPYVKKKEAQGDNGVKPEKVNGYLEKSWKSFIKKVMSGAADDTDRARRMSYIEAVVPDMLKSVLAGSTSRGQVLDSGSVRIGTLTKDKITVSFATAATP